MASLIEEKDVDKPRFLWYHNKSRINRVEVRLCAARTSVTLCKEREVLPQMYAIVVTGGKQYKVSEGDVIYVEKLGAEDGSTVTFDKVLAVGEGAELKVGAPYVEGATVSGTVEKTGKQKKVIVYKMKPKKGYRRKQGHRQPYTKVTIGAINA